MDQILYHYTDFTSLDGIVNKRELRVNNVLNMNDAKEMDLFISGIFGALKDRFSEINDTRMVLRLDEMQRSVQSHYFDLSAYAACFSEARDDAAQWERYANRGKGVCLCFRREILEKMTGDAITLRKVTYQSDMHDHPLVDKLFNIMRQKVNLSNVLEVRRIVAEVCRNSAAYKHPSFASESEIRLVVMPLDMKSMQIKPQYNVKRERIKKYYPLDLDKMCRRNHVDIEDLISEVMVGPESTQSPQILRDYLLDLGLKKLAAAVSTSDCPLRSKI